jgi:hypothetical protein
VIVFGGLIAAKGKGECAAFSNWASSFKGSDVGDQEFVLGEEMLRVAVLVGSRFGTLDWLGTPSGVYREVSHCWH